MVLRPEPLRHRLGIDASLGYLGEHAVIEREHPVQPVLPREVRYEQAVEDVGGWERVLHDVPRHAPRNSKRVRAVAPRYAREQGIRQFRYSVTDSRARRRTRAAGE